GAVAVALHHQEPAIDLLSPIHPRGVLLADEAALGETNSVQLHGIAFEPEDIAELGAAFADAEPKTVLEPARRRFGRRSKPALAQLGQARVIPTVLRPVNGQIWTAFDRNRPAQAVDREAFDEVVRCIRFAIEEQVITL